MRCLEIGGGEARAEELVVENNTKYNFMYELWETQHKGATLYQLGERNSEVLCWTLSFMC